MKKGVLIFVWILMLSSGAGCSSNDSPRETVDNEYSLDGLVTSIETHMYWENSAKGGMGQLRIEQPLDNTSLRDLIVISPVQGPSSLEGTYIYSRTEDVGTYDLSFVHATDGEDHFAWYTRGDSGAPLEIKSMGKQDGQDIYRILIPSFTLNYGYWDFLAGKWVSSCQ